MNDIVTKFLSPILHQKAQDNRPIVIMTCRIAGSGKTTLAKTIQAHHPSMRRLSIDEIVFSKHGLYGIDYPASASLYAEYQAEADIIYLSTFRTLLAEGKDVILERSFYAKQDREMYRELAEQSGARVMLVFLRAQDKEVLWERIQKRSEGAKTADSAVEIDRVTFERYWEGFEGPDGEGKVVVEVK